MAAFIRSGHDQRIGELVIYVGFWDLATICSAAASAPENIAIKELLAQRQSHKYDPL